MLAHLPSCSGRAQASTPDQTPRQPLGGFSHLGRHPSRLLGARQAVGRRASACGADHSSAGKINRCPGRLCRRLGDTPVSVFDGDSCTRHGRTHWHIQASGAAEPAQDPAWSPGDADVSLFNEGPGPPGSMLQVEGQQQDDRLSQVPWGGGKVITVMSLWLIAYIVMGQVAVPIALSLLGLDRDELTTRGHALLHLSLDVSQLSVTLGILWGSLRQYNLKVRKLFPVRFWPPTYLWLVAGCCLVFPLVDIVAQQSVGWFTSDADLWAAQLEQSLNMGDWVTNVAYLLVFSICAPIWEEAMFRGFLLTSLLRYMPTAAAVLVSSLIFAMCHFKLQTLLPLLLLGTVFSGVYLKTRNLVACIVLHSLWNVYVLLVALGRPG